MRGPAIGMLLVIGLGAAGCASSSTTANAPATSTAQSASSGATSTDTSTAASGSSAPTTAALSTYAATGTATDGQGDAATVSITVGSPTALTSLNQQDMSSCDDINLGDDANQTIAVPTAITVTLTSSIATSVAVSLDGTQQVTSGGNVQPNGNLPSWAAASSDDAECSSDSITWNSLASGQSDTWSGWLIEQQTITPDDPTGSSASETIFLEPVVDLGMNDGDFVPDLAHSRNLVKCAAGVPDGAVIAVDPKVALSSGCTKYTGN